MPKHYEAFHYEASDAGLSLPDDLFGGPEPERDLFGMGPGDINAELRDAMEATQSNQGNEPCPYNMLSQGQFKQLRDVVMDLWLEGTATIPGFVHKDSRRRGAYVFYSVTPSGAKSIRRFRLEEEPAARHPSEEAAGARDALPLKDAWDTVRNESAPASIRFDALRVCASKDPEKTASFLVDELARNDLAADWRDEVILAIEDIYLPKPEWQRLVCDRLLEIAASIRISQSGSEEALRSALRRASSLLDRAKAHLLLPFLERAGAVDTRLVTLQCVYRVFELEPPTDNENLEALRGRVAGYAKKFLDPDVFTGGEIAAIAQESVAALAALGDQRLEESVSAVNGLRRRWLTEQTQATFEELLVSWRENNPSVVSHEAYRVVASQLARLRDQSE